jgi:hypothetical protein
MSWKNILKKSINFVDVMPKYPYETGGEFIDEPSDKQYQKEYLNVKRILNLTGEELLEIPMKQPDSENDSPQYRIVQHIVNFGDEPATYCLAHGYGPIDMWSDCSKCMDEHESNPHEDGRYKKLTPLQAWNFSTQNSLASIQERWR